MDQGENTTRTQGDFQGDSRDMREFVRAENEDDDGYDPYSDRPPAPDPLFERDPWA